MKKILTLCLLFILLVLVACGKEQPEPVVEDPPYQKALINVYNDHGFTWNEEPRTTSDGYWTVKFYSTNYDYVYKLHSDGRYELIESIPNGKMR